MRQSGDHGVELRHLAVMFGARRGFAHRARSVEESRPQQFRYKMGAVSPPACVPHSPQSCDHCLSLSSRRIGQEMGRSEGTRIGGSTASEPPPLWSYFPGRGSQRGKRSPGSPAVPVGSLHCSIWEKEQAPAAFRRHKPSCEHQADLRTTICFTVGDFLTNRQVVKLN